MSINVMLLFCKKFFNMGFNTIAKVKWFYGRCATTLRVYQPTIFCMVKLFNLDRLLDQADKLFPDSKLFQLIPLFQKADTSWKAKLQQSEVVFIRNEIAEWNLQANAVDQELLDLFAFPD